MSAPRELVMDEYEERDAVKSMSKTSDGLLIEVDERVEHTSSFHGMLRTKQWVVEAIHWSDRVIRIIPIEALEDSGGADDE